MHLQLPFVPEVRRLTAGSQLDIFFFEPRDGPPLRARPSPTSTRSRGPARQHNRVARVPGSLSGTIRYRTSPAGGITVEVPATGRRNRFCPKPITDAGALAYVARAY